MFKATVLLVVLTIVNAADRSPALDALISEVFNQNADPQINPGGSVLVPPVSQRPINQNGQIDHAANVVPKLNEEIIQRTNTPFNQNQQNNQQGNAQDPNAKISPLWTNVDSGAQNPETTRKFQKPVEESDRHTSEYEHNYNCETSHGSKGICKPFYLCHDEGHHHSHYDESSESFEEDTCADHEICCSSKHW